MTKNEMGAALERPSGAPTWLILVLGMGGLGGLGLGGAQLAKAPDNLDAKLTALVSQVAQVGTKIDVLTTQVQARDKSDDRERSRVDSEISDLKIRVKHLEDRRGR
jgi:outer membrane murein-binding lipoprotein Lpp